MRNVGEDTGRIDELVKAKVCLALHCLCDSGVILSAYFEELARPERVGSGNNFQNL